MISDDNSMASSEQKLPFPKFINQTRAIDRAFNKPERKQLRALPRTAYNAMELQRPKSPWHIKKSVFATYKFDND